MSWVSFRRVSGQRDRRHEAHARRQRLALVARQSQAELAAPPQDIVGVARPFLLHQIAHLGGGEVGAETLPEIVADFAPRRGCVDARAVGARQPPRMRLGQERPVARAPARSAPRRRPREYRRPAAARARSRPARARRNGASFSRAASASRR